MGCHFLLQGIFPDPGIEPGSPTFQADTLTSEPPGSPNPKECLNYHTISLISHASKVMLKILQARLQQYVNHELTDVQAGFRKGRGTRDQIANIHWIIDKAREFEKKKSILLTMLKSLTAWITTNCRKFFKRWEYQTNSPVS